MGYTTFLGYTFAREGVFIAYLLWCFGLWVLFDKIDEKKEKERLDTKVPATKVLDKRK